MGVLEYSTIAYLLHLLFPENRTEYERVGQIILNVEDSRKGSREENKNEITKLQLKVGFSWENIVILFHHIIIRKWSRHLIKNGV